jgi:hypothetical protein
MLASNSLKKDEANFFESKNPLLLAGFSVILISLKKILVSDF